VINKLRALNAWYSRGLDGGSHLRVAINAADSIAQLREIIDEFFSRGTVGERVAVPAAE
jgi:tRNA-dihydrouridine synthase